MPASLDAQARADGRELCSLLLGVAVALAVEVWFVVSIELVAPDEALNAQKHALVPVVVAENQTAPAGKKASAATVNALAIAGGFILMAALLLYLVKSKRRRLLRGWLMTSSLVVYMFLGAFILDLMCTSYQLPYDLPTAGVILANFGVVGVLNVHGRRGHWLLRRGYLIATACIIAWFLTKLPPVTTWILLGIYAAYDAGSVLWSKGIVRGLMGGSAEGPGTGPAGQDTEHEMSERSVASGGEADDHGDGGEEEEEEEEASTRSSTGEEYDLPGYDEDALRRQLEASATGPPPVPGGGRSTAVGNGGGGGEKAEEEDEASPRALIAAGQLRDPCGVRGSEGDGGGGVGAGGERYDDADDDDDDEEGMLAGLLYETEHHQLGLGDFIFYALLVGRSVKAGGYLPAVSAAGGVLLGLIATLVHVSLADSMLPALPLPILLGTAGHFVAMNIYPDYLLVFMIEHSDGGWRR